MQTTLGVVLAGGRSSRFGEQDKASSILCGKPLIQHVVERLSPQVDALVLSGPSGSLAISQLSNPALNALTWIEDTQPGHQGPLAAVLRCLEYAKENQFEWLLTSPCDTPFLPDNLHRALFEQAQTSVPRISISKEGGRLQPAHGLWHSDCLPLLQRAVLKDGLRGFHQFFDRHDHTTVDWSTTPNAFFNINRQDDLPHAEQIFREVHHASSDIDVK